MKPGDSPLSSVLFVLSLWQLAQRWSEKGVKVEVERIELCSRPVGWERQNYAEAPK